MNVVDRHPKLARLARGGGGEAEPDLNGPSAKPNRRALPDEGVRPEPARMRRERGRTGTSPVSGFRTYLPRERVPIAARSILDGNSCPTSAAILIEQSIIASRTTPVSMPIPCSM